MNPLYELTEELNNVNNLLESLEGEDIPAELAIEVDRILAEKEATYSDLCIKIDSYCRLIQSRQAFYEMRKKEADRLAKLAESDKKTVDFLKERLRQHLESTNQQKLRTKTFNLSLRQASQAPLHLKVNPEDLPIEYKKVDVQADKKALREALKKGDESVAELAEFGVRSTYISIR